MSAEVAQIIREELALFRSEIVGEIAAFSGAVLKKVSVEPAIPKPKVVEPKITAATPMFEKRAPYSAKSYFSKGWLSAGQYAAMRIGFAPKAGDVLRLSALAVIEQKALGLPLIKRKRKLKGGVAFPVTVFSKVALEIAFDKLVSQKATLC